MDNKQIQARIGIEGEQKPRLTINGAIVQEVVACSHSLGNGRYCVRNFGEVHNEETLEQLRQSVVGGVRKVKRSADENDS